jgi:Holliday junction DNA helicase RuvA
MISTLLGEIASLEEDSVVVLLGGVGLRVYVPAPLKERLRIGAPIQLQTHLVVREDSLTLYGFESAEERDLFQLLLSVSGIGPRTALATLSALPPDSIKRAVFNEESDILSRVPGIGKKTAQRIILALQDKLTPEDVLTRAAALDDIDSEVLAALTALGYSIVEAQTALQSIPKDAPDDVETRLRLALGYFS